MVAFAMAQFCDTTQWIRGGPLCTIAQQDALVSSVCTHARACAGLADTLDIGPVELS